MSCTKDQILLGLNPNHPASIQALIDFHRARFGGWVMTTTATETGASGTGGESGGQQSDKQQTGQSGSGGDTKDDEKLGEPGLKALQAERDARKALETQLQQFKTDQADQAKRLAEALGIKTDAKSTGDDLVKTLQDQVQQMQRDNLVYRVAGDLKITEAGDLDLLKLAPDEDAMRKLGARLAAKAEADTAGKDTAKGNQGRPKPDRSAGSGGDKGAAKPGDEGRAEAARRFGDRAGK